MNAQSQRDTAVFDTYAGLRTLGYTYIGALRALRTLGLSLAEAKAQADRYESKAEFDGRDVDAEEIAEEEECPACDKRGVLSDERIGAITFTEPVCEACRSKVERELSMDSFDVAYERERARGWAD